MVNEFEERRLVSEIEEVDVVDKARIESGEVYITYTRAATWDLHKKALKKLIEYSYFPLTSKFVSGNEYKYKFKKTQLLDEDRHAKDTLEEVMQELD